MVISNILGGLGNQMFQYAVGRSLSLRHKKDLKLDIGAFENYTLRNYELELFQLEVEIASQEEIDAIKYSPSLLHRLATLLLGREIKRCSNFCYKERYFHFDANLLKYREEDVYLLGYWQSEKYFSEYRSLLLEEFTPAYPLDERTLEYKKEIGSKQSVSLHIRRGDYVSDKTTNSYHGVCSLEYYREAVLFMHQNMEDLSFFIFSDDLVWAKEHLSFIDNLVFVELPDDVPDYEEMYLMSQCSHNIIANSSFSWWGAWLNQNEKKRVVAPKRWFTDPAIDTGDLIPKAWKRI